MSAKLDTTNLKRTITAVVAGLILILFISLSGKMWEDIGAGEIVVIQGAFDGKLHVYKQSGVVWQGFGTVTRYKKSFQYWFSKSNKKGDGSIKMRFNDGGHANLSGSIRVDLPLSDSLIVQLHTRFGSQEAIENTLVSTVITKSVYMTAPLMSSKESYSERRNDLISYIEDQATNGVYKTYTTTMRVKDPMDTTVIKTISVVRLRMSENGTPLVEEKSPVSVLGIKLSNLGISDIDYDPIVEEQIKTQQQATMQVQTAIAHAKQAEQETFTVEQQGKANAAKAKWEQETKKAQAVTEAEQNLAVQELATKTSLSYKQQQIYEGEGEAEKKRLAMSANGALEQKLATYEKVNAAYAKAMENSTWVPSIVMGSNGGSNSTGAAELINLLMAKTAKDLSLDLTPKK